MKASIADNVAAILELYPPAREDNNLLVILYWQVCDGLRITGDLANKVAEATAVESIVRARREVLEQKQELLENKSKLKNLITELEAKSSGTKT
jgi:serine/threonine protein phosphatase PrpC